MRPARSLQALGTVVVLLFFGSLIRSTVVEVVLHLGYLTRPMWDNSRDTTDPPHTVIPNFGFMSNRSCGVHGFKIRSAAHRSSMKIWDMFLFSQDMFWLKSAVP